METSWWDEDARLVQEESEQLIQKQKSFLAAEESLAEWDLYISGLSIEEAEAALAGLKEYARTLLEDEDIDIGWHKHL